MNNKELTLEELEAKRKKKKKQYDPKDIYGCFNEDGTKAAFNIKDIYDPSKVRMI